MQSFSDSLTPSQRDLGLALIAFLAAVILWQVQGLYVITFPLRLFVTMIHELGHGTAALLTGGEFLRFEVSQHGAGLAYTRGGTRFLIIQAGYLGTALFGAALLVVANRSQAQRPIAIGLGLLIGTLALLFSGLAPHNLGLIETLITAALAGGAVVLALTGQNNERRWMAGVLGGAALIAFAFFGGQQNTPLTIVVGLASAAALIIIGYRASRDVILVTLNFLAFLTGLQAITDAWVLSKIVSMPESMMPMNDASAMTQAYGGTPLLWALVWVGVDLLLFGAAIYWVFIRSQRRSITPPVSSRPL